MWRNGAIKCFAGCSSQDVIAALDAKGFTATVEAKPLKPDDIHQAREAQIRKAQGLWADTAPYWVNVGEPFPHDTEIVAWYLREFRGITLPVPSVMRRWSLNGYIVAVQQRSGIITAIYRRESPADHKGRSIGWMGNGAVELSIPLNGELG